MTLRFNRAPLAKDFILIWLLYSNCSLWSIQFEVRKSMSTFCFNQDIKVNLHLSKTTLTCRKNIKDDSHVQFGDSPVVWRPPRRAHWWLDDTPDREMSRCICFLLYHPHHRLLFSLSAKVAVRMCITWVCYKHTACILSLNAKSSTWPEIINTFIFIIYLCCQRCRDCYAHLFILIKLLHG